MRKLNLFSSSSDCFNLRGEYEVMLRKREEKVSCLPHQKKRDLEGVMVGGSSSKKSKMEMELTEDGVHQLDVKYNRY